MQTANTHHDDNRMMDAARLRAHALRREAIQEAWHDVGSVARRALRCANRLAHALARHAQLRNQHEGA